MISTPIFDDLELNPLQAIANRTHKTHGAVPHLPHWQIIATYDVKPDTSIKVTDKGKQQRAARAQFDVVYVCEYLFDRPMRAHLKIDDSCLDPMADSWYLTKRSS